MNTPDIQALQPFRRQRIQEQLRANDCGAVLLFDPINIRYATGSRNMQVWTMHNSFRYALILENGRVILFELPSCMRLAAKLPGIDEVRPAYTADFMAVADRTMEMAGVWAADIASVLAEAGLGKEKIAIDRVELNLMRAAEQAGIRLVDGKRVMELARAVKSVAEIEALRWSLTTCEQAVSEMRARLEPGMRESTALGMLIGGCIDRGGEYPETRLLTSGPRTNPWFQETSDRVIENGDMLAFDTDMVGPLGFYNDISRSWVVGDRAPNDKQRYLYTIAYQQLQHNIALLKPGLGFLDYSDNGYRLPKQCIPNRYADVAHGCGMGVEYPFIWYREDAKWGAYDGVFEENMVVCVECYAGEVDGPVGVKLEQPVWLRETGPEVLSALPLEQDYLL